MNAPQKSVLPAKGVHYDITGRTIVSGINPSSGMESITAIVGVSGASKSTLLRALGKITKPTVGEVEVNGKSMSSISSRYHAYDLVFVTQDEVPPVEMRVRDFVSLGRLPYQRLLGSNTAEDNSHVDRVLVLVGLETVAQHLYGQLSGGQRCRVCLTRVITQGSSIILLDKPTNHLDVRRQRSALQLIRSSKACIIAAIHDLDLVTNHFDRAIVVADGNIAVDGIPIDVLTRDFVAKIFQAESCQFNSSSSRHHLAIDSELDAATTNQEYSLE